mmetsp:Transcript_32357/g.54290  ORF Transcript_32357/g.54290 Transcript_32357/m.54290 type:complete len:368 (+) Transcript_32357:367-1470(+)|eukprot:CAMPEP_0198210930 /NCGR_PEP_ID=MMETSP1445-20131203/22525_1 /TAXON_ID=36898 /ORGANISM="Pyramimonas sp., Strain CCMP2087" /LENGTH=367 /DNA_ID=CAMNT_0043885099 /DNA_START=316 /DNA_END=1419 /DNA_ORIENTATION=+
MAEKPKLWKYLSKAGQVDFFGLTDDPERQAGILAMHMGLPEYKGDPRSAIKLDYASYNLSFAKESGFSETQTSAFFTFALDVLQLISDGADVASIQGAIKAMVLPLLSVKSQDAMELSSTDKDALDAAREVLAVAKSELHEFTKPPEKPITPEKPTGKKGKAPEPEPEPEAPDPERVMELEAAVQAAQQSYDAVMDGILASQLSFAPPDIKKITDYTARMLLAHFKLYKYACTLPQEVVVTEVVVKVETTVRPRPLREGKTGAEVDADKAAAAQKVAEAEEERSRAEAEAAAAEAEAAKIKAAEDKAAAEEEMRARKPTTLDEAVEKAISVRLTEEKARLAAEYTAREEQLVAKIKNMEERLAAASA